MKVEAGVRIMAGSLVLISVALTWWVSDAFLWLTLFIGANLLQSGFTGICPARALLRRLGCED
ncbi:MAG: YgaP family membrane protein [Aeromonadaceae bacterium]